MKERELDSLVSAEFGDGPEFKHKHTPSISFL